MTIRDFKTAFINQLASTYDVIEAENIFHLLLEDWNNLKRVDLATNHNLEFSKEDQTRFNEALHRLEKGEPVQYIIGFAHFFGLKFEVNQTVLIPRQETEELVAWIIDDHEFYPSKKILDIGTGSGCIPITLAKNLKTSQVSTIDVSQKAVETAKRNASANEVSVHFIETDVLLLEKLPQKFDIIVSNPPYVRELEKHEIKPNVLEHEPHLALFVTDEDPLIFYRKIAQLAFENLSENGNIYFEINQYLGSETVNQLETIGFKNVELRKDLLGNHRMIKATK